MSKEFTLLIIVTFAIAAPVAYYIMHQWLQNYTYRIQLGASIFLLAIIGSIVIAWNGWTSCNKSSVGKSRKEFENGIVFFVNQILLNEFYNKQETKLKI